MRSAKHVAHTGEMKNEHKILVEEPNGNRPLGSVLPSPYGGTSGTQAPSDTTHVLQTLLSYGSENNIIIKEVVCEIVGSRGSV